MVIEYMVVPCDLRLAQFLLCWGCSKRVILSWSQLKTCWTVIRAQSEQSPLKISQLIADTFIFKKMLCALSSCLYPKNLLIFFSQILKSVLKLLEHDHKALCGTYLFFIGELPPPMTFFHFIELKDELTIRWSVKLHARETQLVRLRRGL